MIPPAAGCKQGMTWRMWWRVPRRFNAQQLCQSIAQRQQLSADAEQAYCQTPASLYLFVSLSSMYIRPRSYNTCSLERFRKNKRKAHLNTLLEFRLYGKPHTREACNNMHLDFVARGLNLAYQVS